MKKNVYINKFFSQVVLLLVLSSGLFAQIEAPAPKLPTLVQPQPAPGPATPGPATPGPATQGPATTVQQSQQPTQQEGIGPVINFNNVSIVEFLRFISRLTGRNFVFDPAELQFPVTIISESPASIDDIMAMLLQNLRIHGFELIEQGPNFLIHMNPNIKSPADMYREDHGEEPQIATQVFLIQYVDPQRVATIVKTMLSKDAIAELIPESKRLVITDVAANITKVSELLKKLDSPKSGLEIGLYIGQNASSGSLAAMASELLAPLLYGQTFVVVPHPPSNGVFVISSPFLVDKALAIMQQIDLGENISSIFSLDAMKFNPELAKQRRAALTQPGFSAGEIQQLGEDQIRNLLHELGYSDDQIRRMSAAEIQAILQHMKEAGPAALAAQNEIRRKKIFESSLPLGQVESTQFSLHKLQYRNVQEVIKALHAIATSLQASSGPQSTSQSDLITTLNTVQGIDESNTLVITGTKTTLQKTKDLVAEIDSPVRQVLIEVLVLDTTINNSLNFSVQYGGTIQNKNYAVEGGLFANGSNFINGNLATFTGTTPATLSPQGLFAPLSSGSTPQTPGGAQPPAPGLTLGAIGRVLRWKNIGFVTLAALLNALRNDDDTRIVINPKITTEHNVPAEIFVGSLIPIKTQTITNTNSDFTTANYETQQTGVTLKVTPLIASKDTVTLIIEQTISTANQQQVNSQGANNAAPATINETRTLTRVHLPSDHFIMMSGMINDTTEFQSSRIPCLGSLPFIGMLFTTSAVDTQTKRNLILFIRPHVMENTGDIDDTTKKQQENFKERERPGGKDADWTILDDAKFLLNFNPSVP